MYSNSPRSHSKLTGMIESNQMTLIEIIIYSLVGAIITTVLTVIF